MNKQILGYFLGILLLLEVRAGLAQNPGDGKRGWHILYEQSFEEVEEGSVPEDFFVLDGKFLVAKRGEQKCLVLGGHPVDEHGFLFGPRLKNPSVELAFSCLGGFQSRKHNVYAGALSGLRGIHYRINPSFSEFRVTHSDYMDKRDGIKWSPKEWMRVHILAQPEKQEKTQFRVHIYRADGEGKDGWKSNFLVDGLLVGGKCALWGFSYAEQEMAWDNLVIRGPK